MNRSVNVNGKLQTYNDCIIVRYYLNCCDRVLAIVFNNQIHDSDIMKILNNIDELYNTWVEYDYECDVLCENIVDNLNEFYKSNIVCVINGGI